MRSLWWNPNGHNAGPGPFSLVNEWFDIPFLPPKILKYHQS